MKKIYKYLIPLFVFLSITLYAQETNKNKLLNACKQEMADINNQILYLKIIADGLPAYEKNNISPTNYGEIDDGFLIYFDSIGRIRKFVTLLDYPEYRGFSEHYFDKKGSVVYSIYDEHSAMDTVITGIRYMHKNKLVHVDIELRDEEDNLLKVIKQSGGKIQQVPSRDFNIILHTDSLKNYCRQEDLTFSPDDSKKVVFALPKTGEKTIINTRTSDIRVSPSNNAQRVTVAHLGDNIKIIDNLKNSWYKVSINDKTGYIKAESLEQVEHEIRPKLQKLDKLFIVGDFDGDGKQDTLFQHNFSQQNQMEIDSIPLSLENEWDKMTTWFNRHESEVYLSLHKPTTEDLYLGTAFGLYCLLNIGDINADGKDEIALVPDLFDESAVNTCQIYTLYQGKWKGLKSFEINESAFEFGTSGTKPVFTEIKGFLEKHNGVWMYLDYSEYLENPDNQEEPQFKPLKPDNTDYLESSPQMGQKMSNEKDEFTANPPISKEEIAMIQPVIKKWTDFYGIDLTQARLVRQDRNCFNCRPDSSFYYRPFTKDDDSSRLIEMDYSPNKQRYINIGILYEERDQKRYFIGWDDCQEIYLVDRKLKHQNMILWLGSSEFAEAAFWKSNDTFIIVGYMDNEPFLERFVYVFDIANQVESHYKIKTNKERDNAGYMNTINLKEKGIIPE